MNPSSNSSLLDTCGCCEENISQPKIHNRPGMPALNYRLGTHSTFLSRMLAFSSFTAHAIDDPAVALLDAWAAAADVLTFYQERIANEGYLRTATERRSVMELARAVGYELNPGVSASTFLAFSVDDTPSASGIAVVPQGTKVQSIPDQGQLPQTFETGKEITARARWNALHPRLTRPQEIAISSEKLYLIGISTSFGIPPIDSAQFYPLDPAVTLPDSVQALEVRQIYLAMTGTDIKAGDRLLFVGKRGADKIKTLILPVQSVVVEAELKRIRVDLGTQIKTQIKTEPPEPPFFVPLFLKRAAIRLQAIPFNAFQVNSMVRRRSWRERDLAAFLSIQGWNERKLVNYINTDPVRKLPLADAGIFAFHEKLGFFGHNAPLYSMLPGSIKDSENDWDAGGGRSIWKDNSKKNYYSEADIFLERIVPELISDSWVIFESPAKKPVPYRVSDTRELSLADYAISARVSGLKLTDEDGNTLQNNTTDKPDDFKVRKTTAFARSFPLELADISIEETLNKDSLQLDRMVPGLQVDQSLILSGERNDLRGIINSEVVTISDIRHSGGFTTLFFNNPLQYSYVRKTVTINANVVQATHGETVTEVLGSGDGMQSGQRFALGKLPLTYISSSMPGGSESTLEVRVNGIKRQEKQHLFGLDAQSDNYMVRIEDDGTTRIIFGDGKMGARLPTGTENVSVTYRSGIGLSGMVESDRLTLLLVRPPGIRSVTNPLPADGAAEPENRDSARANAPLRVLTLDRIVSIQDFEDFTRSFAGIGKAQAVALLKERTQLVHITIAQAASQKKGGVSSLATNVVDKGSALFMNLVEAIYKCGDPARKFLVDSYQPVFFNLKAKVLVDKVYRVSDVMLQVENALKTAFSFEHRTFGQSVTEAEVVTIIQNVPGVIAVDLDQLYRYQDEEIPVDIDEQIVPEVLDSLRARWDRKNNSIQPAQLLLINPAGIKLEEMKS